MYPQAMQWKNHEQPPLRDEFLIQTSILSRDFMDFLPSLINRRTLVASSPYPFSASGPAKPRTATPPRA